jgi:lysophospholipase-3
MAFPLLLLLVLAAAPRSLQAWPWRQLHPIVVVPGYASNELDARLTDLYRPSSPRCGERKGQGWFRLFLNQSALHDPAGVRCFGEQMTAVYDAASDDYYNIPGVETRVPFFGSTKAFRYPDPDDK